MIHASYDLPWYKTILRWIARPVFSLIFHILSPIDIHGKKNVPRQGAYLMVFNHVSLYDAPLLLAVWPRALEALGAQDIWSRPGQSTLAKLYGVIPVLRGEVDRNSITAVLAALRSGHPLMMAPEGGRSHGRGMAEGKSGIVYFIEAAGVPVLPVGIVGTTDDYIQRALRGLRPRVNIIIGKSFTLPDGLGELATSPKEIRQCKVDYIMKRIAALLPEEYRGFYSN